MGIEKKEYVAPKYEMIKFDSNIMTAFATGCWGVIGVEYIGGQVTDDTCHVSSQNDPNIFPIQPSYIWEG